MNKLYANSGLVNVMTTIPGWLVGVLGLIIRLSQPGIAGVQAELGNITCIHDLVLDLRVQSF